MNITLFISSLYGGGAERVTCSLASYLAEKGHQVEILTMAETADAYPLSSKVTVSTLLKDSERKGSAYNTAFRIFKLMSYMKRHREKDVYVVMLPRTTIMALALRKLSKACFIASERVDPATYTPKIAKMLKHYARKTDGFVFQTEGARAWYGESVANVCTEVIPNAINPQFILPEYQGEREKKVVAVGRLNSQKNFSLLIRAFRKIAPDFPDYRLEIYGEGSEREELQKQINESGVGERIQLPGNTTEIIQKIRNASLFVLSSDFEGMPNALMEAMALGLPCISTACPCGGPEFLIENGRNGLLVPVNDEDKLAEAMRRVLADQALADSMGKEAAKISQKLDPDTVYSKWESLIEQVVGKESK